jgi:hypothetical protein
MFGTGDPLPMRPQMTTIEPHRYRGYEIKPLRQWEGWCAEAFPTQADLPFLAKPTLDTWAPGKRSAVAQAKRRIDRLLASVE